MFGWLTKMLIKTPILSSGCGCCETKKEQMKKMQKAIVSGEIEIEEEQHFSSGTYRAKCSAEKGCHSEIFLPGASEPKNKV